MTTTTIRRGACGAALAGLLSGTLADAQERQLAMKQTPARAEGGGPSRG